MSSRSILLLAIMVAFSCATLAEQVPDDVDMDDVLSPEDLQDHEDDPVDDCDPEMIGFELITGYVFSAPGHALDSIPALMLTDCLETCQGNESCQAVNYETGLCILFSSNADAMPGKYTKLVDSMNMYANAKEISLQKVQVTYNHDKRLKHTLHHLPFSWIYYSNNLRKILLIS